MNKNVLFFILACGWQTAAYAQQTLQVNALKIGESTSKEEREQNVLTFGNDNYVKIGEWEADDLLSFETRVGYNFSGGNVGIGTTDPKARLDVRGNVAARELTVEEADVSGSITTTNATVTNKVNTGTIVATDATIGRLSVTGAISATSASIGTISVTNATIGTVSATNAKITGNTEVHGKLTAKKDATITGKMNIEGTLDVTGAVRSPKVTITEDVGADFVFNDDYALKPLSEVNHFIQENKHLPEIPSAAEMQSDGVSVGEMQMKLLQKVEELTLYMIQQQATIDALNAKIERLENVQK